MAFDKAVKVFFFSFFPNFGRLFFSIVFFSFVSDVGFLIGVLGIGFSSLFRK